MYVAPMTFWHFADFACSVNCADFVDSADFAHSAHSADFADSADSPSYHPPLYLLRVSYLISSNHQLVKNMGPISYQKLQLDGALIKTF